MPVQFPPSLDAFHRKLARVVGHAHVDHSPIPPGVVDPIGKRPALGQAGEIVREEAASTDQAYRTASSSSVDNRIQSMQKEWNSEQGGAAVQKVLSTRAARLLSRYRETDARFLRITVTDARGLVIAATHKPSMYYYGGDEQWTAVYAGGKGALRLADAKYDETTKTHYVSIGAPIVEEGSSRFLGAVQALVDISPIAALLNWGLAGAGPRASLVKEDGTIIFGPEVSLSMNLKSPEYPAVKRCRPERGRP